MQTTLIIDGLVALHSVEAERPVYRETLCELVKLARAESNLTMELDMMHVRRVMSEGWDG